MPDLYAVVGNPVAHSKSPLIHAQFARQTGEDIAYAAILAPLDGFGAAVAAFRQSGGRGLNVTLPFKHEACELAGRRSARAAQALAANTLVFEGQEVIADNTDGIGLISDIETNLGYPIAGRRVLLMGAGGASYGVLGPLLERAPAELVVANRTPGKAAALARHFAASGNSARTRLSGLGYPDLAGRRFDLIINATSAGLSGLMPQLPAGIMAPGSLAYDMVYGRDTPFLAFARGEGARVADGLGMLVEQAAASFQIWRGVRPDTAAVIAVLRKSAPG
jgi:shikimate dehydrogenase